MLDVQRTSRWKCCQGGDGTLVSVLRIQSTESTASITLPASRAFRRHESTSALLCVGKLFTHPDEMEHTWEATGNPTRSLTGFGHSGMQDFSSFPRKEDRSWNRLPLNVLRYPVHGLQRNGSADEKKGSQREKYAGGLHDSRRFPELCIFITNSSAQPVFIETHLELPVTLEDRLRGS